MFKKERDMIRSEISTIEDEIRKKYRKLIEDEIIEKTIDLKHKLRKCDVKISQHMLKQKDCIHCDVSSLSFRDRTCFMCKQTIRFT